MTTEQRRQYKKAWYEANKEKRKAQMKAWYDSNREKEKARKKVYYEVNKENRKVQAKAYRESNREKEKARRKVWYDSNREKEKARKKVYYEANKEKRKAQWKAYREANREKIKEQKKAYYEANKEKHREWMKVYFKQRYQTDPIYRLRIALRGNIQRMFKAAIKTGSFTERAKNYLGCSFEEFKTYIESQWQTGMTWDNYGLYGWHLDHKIPISTFDPTDEKQVRAACHYTNFQPLWAEENLSKNDDCHPVDRFFLFEPTVATSEPVSN